MRRPLIAAAAAVVLLGGTVAATAAVTSAKYTPPCSTSSNACEDKRIAALESKVFGTTSAPTTVPTTTAPTTTVATPTVKPTTTVAPTTAPTTTTPPSSGFPTAATTGVPAGTQLTTVNGDLASSSSGQVVTGKLITGDFIAGDANVTLKNSRVLGRIVNQSKGLTVTDVDLGPSACPSGPSDFNELGGTNYSLTRVHVVGGGADLIGIGGAGTISVTDSLIDHACFYSGEHLDAAQFYSPGDEGHVTFTHDSLDIRPVNSTDKGNSAIFWADTPAAASTLTVTNSLLAGGNYTLALYDAGTFKITGNTFVKSSYQYGPCATNVPVTFTGNQYDDGTALTSC